MKPIVLAIDLQSCNCDPKIAFPDNTELQEKYAYLDHFASKVSDFHRKLPVNIKTFFAIQETEENAESVRLLTDEEKELHAVEPKKQDQILVKNKYSVVEEHEYVFDDLKNNKENVVILVGVWADKCIPENAEDLLRMGFKVVLPMDLISKVDGQQAFDSFAHLAHNKNLIFTDSAHALQDAYHLMNKAPKPDRVFQHGLRDRLIASTYG